MNNVHDLKVKLSKKELLYIVLMILLSRSKNRLFIFKHLSTCTFGTLNIYNTLNALSNTRKSLGSGQKNDISFFLLPLSKLFCYISLELSLLFFKVQDLFFFCMWVWSFFFYFQGVLGYKQKRFFFLSFICLKGNLLYISNTYF